MEGLNVTFKEVLVYLAFRVIEESFFKYILEDISGHFYIENKLMNP